MKWRYPILISAGLCCSAWGFIYRSFPMPGDDSVLDLVLYHTPSFYGWIVRWYYLSPAVLILLSGLILLAIWRVWFEARDRSLSPLGKLPEWPLDPGGLGVPLGPLRLAGPDLHPDLAPLAHAFPLADAGWGSKGAWPPRQPLPRVTRRRGPKGYTALSSFLLYLRSDRVILARIAGIQASMGTPSNRPHIANPGRFSVGCFPLTSPVFRSALSTDSSG